jgi:hypothetical protein
MLAALSAMLDEWWLVLLWLRIIDMSRDARRLM